MQRTGQPPHHRREKKEARWGGPGLREPSNGGLDGEFRCHVAARRTNPATSLVPINTAPNPRQTHMLTHRRSKSKQKCEEFLYPRYGLGHWRAVWGSLGSWLSADRPSRPSLERSAARRTMSNTSGSEKNRRTGDTRTNPKVNQERLLCPLQRNQSSVRFLGGI